MKGLTTHILDLMNGNPASYVRVDLYYINSTDFREFIATQYTNSDGRLNEPFCNKGELQLGKYEYVFYIGDYFRKKDILLKEPAFLEEVIVRFGVGDVTHYHVPLLVSPWGYQIYRGS